MSGNASVEVELTVFNSGWVETMRGIAISGGGTGRIRMPALFAMIKHPQEGIILYDTGYSTRFFEATKKLPYRLMRYLTPAEIEEEDNADRQIENAGVSLGEVKTIILGHGHADHSPGIVYFISANVIVEKREWEAMNVSPLKAFTKAYLKSLYEGIGNRIEQIDLDERGKPLGPFDQTLDLYGDGSMVLVHLPGHTPGQMGLMLNAKAGKRFFLIGDAAWLSENYGAMKPPAAPARAILSSFENYIKTLRLIHDFHEENPDVIIVPAHCPEAWEKLGEMGVAG